MEQHVFTLGEANSLLPELETQLAQILKTRKYLHYIRDEIQKARNHAEQGGGSIKGPSYVKGLETIIKRLENIQEKGVVVKDLEKGLCDFPFIRDGEVVYLCWMLGESEIKWWHDVHTGFSGRQPLDPEF